MKRLAIVVIALLFIQQTVSSQSCLPEGITFSTQAQIDSFQINYPGCLEIEGYVKIGSYGSSDITNLNGLNVLTAIKGYLQIRYNDALTSLSGLDNVTSIKGGIWIGSNDALTSLSGLDNVTSIGRGLRICYNDALTSLTGLDNVTFIGKYLEIVDNDALTCLSGLDNVTSVGGYLLIIYNAALTSLAGLDNIEAGTISDLYININISLSTCEVQSVCDYLSAPNGNISIRDNATGCNSQEEVEEACEALSVGSLDAKDGLLIIYPNPLSCLTNIEYELIEAAKVSLIIYNYLGQKIETLVNQHQQTGKHQVTWSAEGLPAGIYICKLTAGTQSFTGKMVVLR